jgi:hypothetical protein
MPRIDWRRLDDEPPWKSNLRNVDEAFAEAASLVPFCAIGLIASVLMMTAGFTVVRPAASFPSRQLVAKPVTPAPGKGKSKSARDRPVQAPGTYRENYLQDH